MILEEMFRGNLIPLDLVTPTDPEYYEAGAKVDKLTELLRAQLSLEQKKLLDDLLTEVYSTHFFENEAFFSFGFSAGVQMQREIEFHVPHTAN